MKTKKRQIFSGIAVLSLSNLLVKLVGLFFKIPLQSVLSDEGMGYFNAAYSIYVWFYTLSTAGLPVAVSLLVAKSNAKGDRRALSVIYRTTMLLLGAVGVVFCLCMLFCAKSFAQWIGSPATSFSVTVIAPTILFVCLAGGVRGYFQGLGNMVPTAISQVIEAICKLTLGLTLASYALKQGYPLPVVSAFAVSGLTIGTALGMVFLLLRKRFFRLPKEEAAMPNANLTTKSVCRQLLSIALPVTLSASVMGLIGLTDVMVVIRRLRDLGFAEEAAVALYGNYTTLAVPMFHLPTTLITPLACAIVPPLTAAVTKSNRKNAQTLSFTAFRLTMLLLFPCAVGLTVMSHPILSLLFSGASVAIAAPLLSVLAMAIPFAGLVSVSNSILQVYHLERKPILSMVIGAAVKVVSAWILISMPVFGIYGAPLSTLLSYLAIAACNLYYVAKYTEGLPDVFSFLCKPLVSAVGCVSVACLVRYAALGYCTNFLATVLALLVAAVVYLILLLLLRVVSEAEIAYLPMGKRLLALLRRFGFFRTPTPTQINTET